MLIAAGLCELAGYTDIEGSTLAGAITRVHLAELRRETVSRCFLPGIGDEGMGTVSAVCPRCGNRAVKLGRSSC